MTQLNSALRIARHDRIFPPTPPTPVDIVPEELTRALKLEYLDALNGRLSDAGRNDAVWTAQFRAQPHRKQLEAIVASALYLLDCPHGGLTLVTGREHTVLIGMESVVPVEESFCQHVTDGRPFGVGNALEDLLVCNTRVVTEGGIRAYLGVPVILKGYVIGSLCVWDTEVHEWTGAQVRVLTSLGLTIQELLAS